MKDRRKLVLIGAGSAVFAKGLIADFITAKFGKWTIALCDINGQILESITKLAKKMVEQQGADIVIESDTDRTRLLPGADVVVTTIAVGGRRAWEQDVTVPRKYGVFQPVGDSILPGGIARAQRMIPAMIEIAKDVARLCPDAYFFNYSNPMTAIVTAVRKATGVKMVGLCHGVIYGEKYLARMLGVNVNRVTTFGVGLNHLTFLYDIRVDGRDATEAINAILKRQKEDAKAKGHQYNFFNPLLEDQEIPNHLDNPFSWELWETYHGLPAVLDRHAVEFFPERFPKGAYYGHTLGIDAFPIDDVIARGEKTYSTMLAQADNPQVDKALFERADGEHEQLVEMLKSLFHDERKVFSVNIPNEGAVPSLPEQAVLELPASATGLGFAPLKALEFPEVLSSIIARRLAPVQLTVEAALTGNRGYWVEALLMDGAVTDRDTAKAMVEEFLNLYKDHLPQFS